MKQEPAECPSPIPKAAAAIPVSNINRFPQNARKRPPSTSKNDDVDWVMEQPKRSRPNKNNEVKKTDTVVQ